MSGQETVRSSDGGIDCRPQSTWKAKELHAQGLAFCTVSPAVGTVDIRMRKTQILNDLNPHFQIWRLRPRGVNELLKVSQHDRMPSVAP